jgi:Ca2+-binding EF-hand superfamily protein
VFFYFVNLFKAQTKFLEKKNQSLLENKDLEDLWSALLEQVQDDSTSNGRISYQQFINTRNKLSDKIMDYFSPSLFLKFEKDEKGRISIINFFQFCMRKGSIILIHRLIFLAAFYRTRISINLYDSVGNGYLTEQDFQVYITEMIPSLPQIQKIASDLHPYYTCMAARKFFFSLTH